LPYIKGSSPQLLRRAFLRTRKDEIDRLCPTLRASGGRQELARLSSPGSEGRCLFAFERKSRCVSPLAAYASARLKPAVCDRAAHGWNMLGKFPRDASDLIKHAIDRVHNASVLKSPWRHFDPWNQGKSRPSRQRRQSLANQTRGCQLCAG